MSIVRPVPIFYPAPPSNSLNGPPSPPSPTILPPSHYSSMESNNNEPLPEEIMDDGQPYKVVGGRIKSRNSAAGADSAARKRKSSKLDNPPPRSLPRSQLSEFDGRNDNLEPLGMDSSQEDNQPLPTPVLTRFVVILQPVDKKNSFRKAPPFQLRRDVLALVAAKNVRFLRFGGLAVTVESETDKTKLLHLTTISGVEITASTPRSENYCKGVISRVVPGVTCESLMSELEVQNPDFKVISVKRLGSDKSNTYSIEFSGKTLPTFIYIGFWRHKVRIFYDKVLQCFVCQKFNHSSHECRGTAKCLHCSGPHRLADCDEATRKQPARCCNCSGNHPSFSSSCPAIKVQREICKLKTVQKISYAAAKAIVLPRGRSYADALASRFTDAPVPPPLPPVLPAPPARRAAPPPPPSAVRVSSGPQQMAPLSKPSVVEPPAKSALSSATLLSLIKLIATMAQNEPNENCSEMADLKLVSQKLGVTISSDQVANLLYAHHG